MTMLNLNNPACIEISNHTECGSGDPLTNAVVTAVVYDSDGNEVGGQPWPLSMPYDVATSKYKGVTAILELIEKQVYTVTVTSKTPGGTVLAEWNIDIPATRRLSQ